MKKLVTAFAACIIAGFVSAQVQSQNVVGYNTVALTSQNTLIAVNFDKTSGGNLTINEAFPIGIGMVASNSASYSDNIQILNAAATGYDTYFLCNGYVGKGGALIPAVQNKWVSGANLSTPATVAMPSGQAAWYISRAASFPVNITVAGQVANDATRTKQIKTGLNQISNPYASAYAINSQNWVAMGGVASNSATYSDNIQVQNAAFTGWETYFLCNGYVGKGGALIPAVQNKWVSGANLSTPATLAIQMGKAAWYIARGANFNWVMPVPYTL